MVKVIKLKYKCLKKPFFDPNPHKTTSNNHAWRMGCFDVFEDSEGNEYWYMPKTEEVKESSEYYDAVELLNKELCKRNNEVVKE